MSKMPTDHTLPLLATNENKNKNEITPENHCNRKQIDE